MMALLGLRDDYTHDGRVLIEALEPSAIPNTIADHYSTLLDLARAYKQINAPFGPLAIASLGVSTAALAKQCPQRQRILHP